MTAIDFERASTEDRPTPDPVAPVAHLDLALTAQLVIGWAGEAGEDRRLGWWRSDLVSEFGGEDLFRRLLPSTWRWAALQAARETARRRDAELRREDHDHDRIISLFHLGFDLDEGVEERLQDLKRAGRDPQEALPGLAVIFEACADGWRHESFLAWVRGHGDAEASPSPTGRRLAGAPPASLDLLVGKLVAALAPTGDRYPLPHFRRAS